MTLLVCGGSGRLGSEILRVAAEDSWNAGVVSRVAMQDVSMLSSLLSEPSLICDVSLPAGTEALAQTLLTLDAPTRAKIAGCVVGVTGLLEHQMELLRQVATLLPVCVVPNFSRGIFLFEQILQARTAGGLSVAELARSLGFDLAISEIHHTKKLDAPSGTAKLLAESAQISEERISACRVGAVVGEHSLYCAADSEELRISHMAHTRRLFALGCVDLCKKMWLERPEPGMHPRARFFIR